MQCGRLSRPRTTCAGCQVINNDDYHLNAQYHNQWSLLVGGAAVFLTKLVTTSVGSGPDPIPIGPVPKAFLAFRRVPIPKFQKSRTRREKVGKSGLFRKSRDIGSGPEKIMFRLQQIRPDVHNSGLHPFHETTYGFKISSRGIQTLKKITHVKK